MPSRSKNWSWSTWGRLKKWPNRSSEKPDTTTHFTEERPTTTARDEAKESTATTTGEATGTRVAELLAGIQTGRTSGFSTNSAATSTARRAPTRRPTPGPAISIGPMATETAPPATAGESMAQLRVRTGLSTGSKGTAARGKIGGRTEEAATSPTAITAREAATSRPSETRGEPTKTGKEIRRIMTSQMSAPSKEAAAPEDRTPRRRGATRRLRMLQAQDVVAATEAKSSTLTSPSIRSLKSLAVTGQSPGLAKPTCSRQPVPSRRAGRTGRTRRHSTSLTSSRRTDSLLVATLTQSLSAPRPSKARGRRREGRRLRTELPPARTS